MAGYQALEAAGLSIVDLLRRRLDERDGGVGVRALLANSSTLKTLETDVNNIFPKPAISVFCYRVSVDPETRPGWSAAGSTDGIARLPLRMHLLVGTHVDTANEELRWLGLAAQILEGEPLLTGPMLRPVPVSATETVDPWGEGDAIQVVPDDLAMDSMSEAFQSLDTAYRLQLPYIARVIRIDAPPGDGYGAVGTVAAGVERVTT
ncbi:DUF4255 domain-containing protein [Demequina mangrovi]|uniref:Pvc16 N-terminal domain-containing protein n=1 Tax=Demequina mangrovi TaxID=1043493 RepID=A0A1H6U3T5_9MICO|nr:DUF4255 domain-containing protein [Demequina mangrovi]SEI83055.1 Protein of unknown function [Demequina mangrovi]